MKIFFLLLFFSFFLNAAQVFKIAFRPDKEGLELVGTRIVNDSTSVTPYEHLQEGGTVIKNLLRNKSKYNPQYINNFLSVHINNPYLFLRECFNPACPLTRTSKPGYRDRFLDTLKAQSFPILKKLSSRNHGIDLTFFGSGGLLFEAKIIEALQEEGIKINTVYLIDKHYAAIKRALATKSSPSFDIEKWFCDSQKEQEMKDLIETAQEIVNSNTEKNICTSCDEHEEIRIPITRVIQFRNYITKVDQSPRVVIFDSEEAFSESEKFTHLMIAVDFLEPAIFDQSEELMNVIKSFHNLFNRSFLMGALFNDGGHIMEYLQIPRISSSGSIEQALKTTRYNSDE